MSVFLHVILNISIVVGVLVGYLAAFALIFVNTRSLAERVVRGLAALLGTLAVVGGETVRLDFSSFAVGTLHHHGAAGFLIAAAWTIVGGGAGLLIARYLLSMIDGGTTNLQLRMMILVTVIAHVELLEIYAQNVEREGFALGIGTLPDIAFIAGLLFYLVFSYDTGEVQALGGLLHRGARFRRPDRDGKRGEWSQEPPPAPADEEYPNIFGARPER
jgi:hypothetical protein